MVLLKMFNKKIKSIVDSNCEGKFGYYILYCVYNNDNLQQLKCRSL